jgi:hypothetical protein
VRAGHRLHLGEEVGERLGVPTVAAGPPGDRAHLRCRGTLHGADREDLVENRSDLGHH